MGFNKPKAVISSPVTATDNASNQTPSFNYDVLILECLIHKVSFRDLLNCRLVCKEWASAATKVVKTQSKIVTLNCGRIGRIEEFVKMLRGRDEDRCLPFGRYRVNMTENVVTAGPYLAEFFQHISGEKCFQLSLYYYADCKDKVMANLEAAKSRQGKMGFIHLEELNVSLEMGQKFLDLAMLNLSELLQKSNGLRKLKLFSDDNYSNISNIDLQLLKCLTLKANNFKTLQTLDLSMKDLDAGLAENLLGFDWPLKNLIFDGADFFYDWKKRNRKDGTAFFKLLEKQSGSLESLRLLNFGSSLWNRDVFDHPAMCSQGNKFKFPNMPKLLSLEIQPPEPENDWICCNWDLKENSFLHLFPLLKKFDIHHFLSTNKTGNLDFLPNRNYPCETLEELSMPRHHHQEDDDNQRTTIFYRMIQLFPNVRKLEVWYHKETLQAIFVSLPKLNILWIYGENYNNWDDVFTGASQIKGVDEPSENQAENFEHGAVRSAPRIDNLQELEELVVQTCHNQPGITDVTADLLLKMNNLKIVKFFTGQRPRPEDSESIKWLFSPSCENRLRKYLNLVLEFGYIRDFCSYFDDLEGFYDYDDEYYNILRGSN